MSYFAPYIDARGLHLPTYEDRLEALCAAYRSVFGGDAVLTPAVPDYQLLSVFARALDDTSALVLQACNARNPAYAAGAALDTLLPLYGLTRRPATCSQVTLTFSCGAACEIPAGTVVSGASGVLWATTEAVSASGPGEVTAPAACRTAGPVYAGSGTLTSLVSPVPGVTGVTNAAPSTLGLAPETDAEVRQRISGAFAGRGTATADALTAALRAIPNVRACLLHVNDGEETDACGVPPHALAAVVSGGAVATICQTIFEKKAPGISTYGSMTREVTDAEGHAHSISFSRAVPAPVYVSISLRALEGYDASIPDTLRAAVTAAFGSLGIGEPLNVPQLFGVCYAAAGSLASTFVLTQIQVATTGSGAASYTDLVPVAWNQRLEPMSGGITIQVS